MAHFPLHRCQLLVKASRIHGYGVFADQDISPDQVIEECYTIYSRAKESEFNDYLFDLSDHYGLPLGNGAIYNHSDCPNASYLFDLERSIMIIQATRLIKKGEEIFVNYGEDWFGSRQAKYKEPSLRLKIRRWRMVCLPILRFTIVISVLFGIIIWMR